MEHCVLIVMAPSVPTVLLKSTWILSRIVRFLFARIAVHMVQNLFIGLRDGMKQSMRSAHTAIAWLPMFLKPMLMLYPQWKRRISLQQQRLFHLGLQNVDAVQILSGPESALAAVWLAEFVAYAPYIRTAINRDYKPLLWQQLNYNFVVNDSTITLLWSYIVLHHNTFYVAFFFRAPFFRAHVSENLESLRLYCLDFCNPIFGL
jgi:hypothetical protein